jgi:hypothetical protein
MYYMYRKVENLYIMSMGQDWQPKQVPLAIDVETKAVLKSLPRAHAALAELKGIASTMPNQSILINTLGLQEAKDSSAIENIITAHDDLYKSGLKMSGKRNCGYNIPLGALLLSAVNLQNAL